MLRATEADSRARVRVALRCVLHNQCRDRSKMEVSERKKGGKHTTEISAQRTSPQPSISSSSRILPQQSWVPCSNAIREQGRSILHLEVKPSKKLTSSLPTDSSWEATEFLALKSGTRMVRTLVCARGSKEQMLNRRNRTLV